MGRFEAVRVVYHPFARLLDMRDLFIEENLIIDSDKLYAPFPIIPFDALTAGLLLFYCKYRSAIVKHDT